MSNEITPQDFTFYKNFLLARSGLDLRENQTYLLVSRLAPIAKRLGLAGGLVELTSKLRMGGADSVMIGAVVEAMTTNETSFFRDIKPFASLAELLPSLLAARAMTKTLRIWSAACSTGQESYSIAMTLDEALATKPGWRIEIVGTDISQDVVNKARDGVYSQFEIQRGLTLPRIMKYFEQDGTSWRVKSALRTLCTFKTANLLENLAHLGSFDIIFCRNVLIYFNAQAKGEVLKKLAARLTPDGLLFLGAAETVINHTGAFKIIDNHYGVLRLEKS